MAFMSSSNNNTSSTNRAVNTTQAVNIAHRVSTASTQVNDAYSTNIDNLKHLYLTRTFLAINRYNLRGCFCPSPKPSPQEPLPLQPQSKPITLHPSPPLIHAGNPLEVYWFKKKKEWRAVILPLGTKKELKAKILGISLTQQAQGLKPLSKETQLNLGHLDAKKKFVMYPRFISIFLDKQLVNVPVPLDHFPVNALTSKVFSFMVKKGKHFSGKVTPLFASMLVQSTEDEGATSERPSEPQPTPSPPHPSEANIEPQSDPSPRPSPTPHIPDSIPEVSGGNHGGQSSSDKSLSGNEGDMTLQSVYDLCISLCTQVTYQAKKIKHLKAQIKKLKEQSKPGRKSAKAEPLVHKDSLFDEFDDYEIDNMDIEDAQDVGRTRNGVNAEKEGIEDAVSTKDVVSTDKEKVSTDRSKVSTDRSKDSTDKEKEGTNKEKEGTDKEKDSIVSLDEGTDNKEKDSTVSLDEGTDDRTKARSATPTTPTTTPTMFGDDETIAQVLLNMSQAKAVLREKEKGVELKDIDLKDKGKKKIEEEDESDTESKDIPKAEKKRRKKRLAGEKATKTALSDEYDFIQARIKADRLLALRIQDEKREQFTVEERAKFLHDTIATQRRFLAEQRAIAIRNKPPTRTRLRNQMMTYLKHVGNKKHSDLKSKTFEEIQAFNEKVKRFNESFTAVGSTEDERRIKEMNEGVKDTNQKRLKEEDTVKVPAKVEVTKQGTKNRKWGHFKMIARKKPRKQSDDDSDDEHRKCLRIVAFEGTLDSEIIEKKFVIARLDKGDLKIMMESSTEENDQSDFWSNQQDWKIITWRLVLNSPCFMVKSWLVQDQTILGKDYSNLLIADSLLKTIWFINAPCYGNEALASPKANELTIPEQTATGKGISNPFMAGSLPKTTKPT
ncbi:hypothetical protein Tco_0450228 [Tanacetum coccineum]